MNVQNFISPCINGGPVKLVRQGAEHERGDGPDDDKDGTGEDLILNPLAVVEVLTGPGILYERCVVSILAPENNSDVKNGIGNRQGGTCLLPSEISEHLATRSKLDVFFAKQLLSPYWISLAISSDRTPRM